MIGIGLLLERQQDVDADALFASGADVARLHDAAGRAGDDHPARLGDAAAELDRRRIGRIARRQPRRAEHRHLAQMPIRREHLEAVAQLLEGRAEQLDVAARGAVADEFVGGLADLLDQLLDADRWRSSAAASSWTC